MASRPSLRWPGGQSLHFILAYCFNFEDIGDGQTLITVESIDENPGILLRLTIFVTQVFNKRKEEKMLESEVEALRGYLATRRRADAK